MLRTCFRFIRPRSRSQSGQRSQSCLSNNSKTTEANLTKLHRKIEHYDKVFHAQDLGSYAQGQDSLAVFKVTAIIREIRGHLLHTVTFLVFFYIRFGFFVKIIHFP